VKLLRVLQEREFERVGDTHTIRVDTRVIVASNRDLTEQVNAERFREDLYWRLNVVPITVPPLRARREDIPDLVVHFLNYYNEINDRYVVHIQRESLQALQAYDWPGNVRELENIVERSMIVSSGPELEVEGLQRGPHETRPARAGDAGLEGEQFQTLAELERDYIRAVCERCGWKINGKGGAAERLGLQPNTLRSRMKKLGIRRPGAAAVPVLARLAS
jgi:DNA-binding NtrC family response regulator